MNATGGVHEFPHKLIEEAEENCHFKCTVEVLVFACINLVRSLNENHLTGRPHLAQRRLHLPVCHGLHLSHRPRACLSFHRL